jgi:hypothetical protein
MRAPPLCLLAMIALAIAGCGTTEHSGKVGDTLEANGIEVTVDEVDPSVAVPESDVTGLSQPAAGSKLVGVRVDVCSDHGGAIGPYDFGIETSSGGEAKLKFPQRNYDKSFDSLRDDCGDGWVVFEIPAGDTAERVTFGFVDSGQAGAQGAGDEVDARFSWETGT